MSLKLYIYYHENGVSVFYDDGDITNLHFSKPNFLKPAKDAGTENRYVKVGKEE